MNKLESGAIARYEAALRWSLANGKKVVATVCVIFLGAVLLIPTGLIGAEYMPRTDEGSFQAYIELPVGQNLEQTDEVLAKLEQYILSMPEVTKCLSKTGTPASNNGSVTVQLVDRQDRSRSVWQITDDVRTFARNELKGIVVRVSETQSSVAGVSGGSGMGGGPSSMPIQLEISGANMDHLVAAAAQVQGLFAEVRGVKDIRSSYTEGMPELQLIVDREKAKFYNTSVTEISNVFSAAIAGQKAGALVNDPNNDGQDTDIMVRLKESDGFKASDIRSIPVQAGNHRVFFGDIAKIKEGVGPVQLRRVDKQRSIVLQANLTDRPLAEVLQEIKVKLAAVQLGNDVTYRFTGQADNMKDTFSEMAQALALSLILVYMMLAVLYESLMTPFIRMFSLPLGLIGSLLLLAITRNTINLYSLIGVLVMDGLVAKNGTLLLDYTLTLMDRGMSAYDALIEAGKARLKPIFMTTLTMVVGMLPTALAITEGAETRVSMAWVLIGGLLSSTFFTLIIIPIIFLYFERHPLRLGERFKQIVVRIKHDC